MRWLLQIRLIVFSLLVFLATSVQADTMQDSGQWWLNGGLGLGSFANLGSGFADEASFNYKISRHQLLTARVNQIHDIGVTIFQEVTCGIAQSANQQCQIIESNLNDYSALYGLIAKAKYGYVSASAGLGYVSGNEPGIIIDGNQSGGDKFSGIAIPAEIQAFVTPLSYVGIGLIGFGNINSGHNSLGALVALQIGKLR